MDRISTLALPARHKIELTRRFGVTDPAWFGSTVRSTTGPDGDVDVLVGFDGPAISQCCFGLRFYMEDLLDRPVDLVAAKALRPEWRPYIERDAEHV